MVSAAKRVGGWLDCSRLDETGRLVEWPGCWPAVWVNVGTLTVPCVLLINRDFRYIPPFLLSPTLRPYKKSQPPLSSANSSITVASDQPTINIIRFI